MAKLLALFTLCVLPAIATAITEPFVVTGKVFCDYCRVGYEVNPVQHLGGSTVLLTCRSRTNPNEMTYSKKEVTRANGEYRITVERDCGDDICEVSPFASSDDECSIPCDGRDRARVAITRNNGMVSNTRYANNVAFTRKAPLGNCPQLLQQYEDLDSLN